MAATEPHLAALAVEWLVRVVSVLVRSQLIGVAESTIADSAYVWPFASVYAQMAPQIGHLYELPVAVRAMIWFLASVQPHMRFQMMIASETLMALGTFERLFTGVRAFVVLQHMFIAE